MTETSTGILELWPTPLYIADQAEQTSREEVVEMNAQLHDLILKAEARDEGAFNFGMIGAQKSSIDLLRWEHPAVHWLRSRLLSAVRDLSHDTLGGQAETATSYPIQAEGWAVVYHEGASHKQHTHHDSVWSGTYYVATGGVDAGAGHLQLLDPRPGAIARSASPGVGYVRPFPGLLVVFPSWLPHSVKATLSATGEPRIGVAFNVTYDLEPTA